MVTAAFALLGSPIFLMGVRVSPGPGVLTVVSAGVLWYAIGPVGMAVVAVEILAIIAVLIMRKIGAFAAIVRWNRKRRAARSLAKMEAYLALSDFDRKRQDEVAGIFGRMMALPEGVQALLGLIPITAAIGINVLIWT